MSRVWNKTGDVQKDRVGALQRISPMFHPFPLSHVGGRWVGQYQIQIQLKPLRYRQGWTHFSLYLKDREGRLTSQESSGGGYVTMPVLEGIHSRGGRWVKG